MPPCRNRWRRRKAFWAVRDICSEFGQVLGPHISYDIGLAVARHGRVRQPLQGSAGIRHSRLRERLLRPYRRRQSASGVLGARTARRRGSRRKKWTRIIYGLVREMGGSVSAEHGIGTLKKKWLGHARSEAEIALMRTLKAALDPDRPAQSRKGDLIEAEARGPMKSFKLDTPKSLSQQVMLRLRQAIIEGEFGARRRHLRGDAGAILRRQPHARARSDGPAAGAGARRDEAPGRQLRLHAERRRHRRTLHFPRS